MNTNRNHIRRFLRIPATMLALFAFSVFGAYATMGIYSSGKNTDRPKSRLLAQKSALKPGTFTLKSGYVFRGGQLFTNVKPSYINLNSAATYQIGNTVYTVPLKKQLLMGGKLTVSIQNQIIR
jgi:hypothetical protein